MLTDDLLPEEGFDPLPKEDKDVYTGPAILFVNAVTSAVIGLLVIAALLLEYFSR